MEVGNKVSHDGDAHSDDDKMSVEGESELIGILDAGAQYGKIIDRRVRELNVETIILPLATPAEELQSKNFKGLIISGSGASVNDSTLTYDPDIFSLGVPILGICYGYHLIIKHFGGEIGKECNREDGQFEVKLDTSCLLFNDLSPDQDVLLTHGDFAKMLPDCLIPIGWSGNVFTAISHTELPVFGLQFHPEVELTVNGSQILNNFLYKIANCKGLYQMTNREENCLQYIKRFVGDGHVLCLVSGGVDSAACTALITKALGSDRVTTVHIDNGFMRKDESSQVAESLNQIGINPQVISAGLTFRDATTLMSYCDQNGHIYRQPTPRLNACINAEEKRHIIGDTFVKIATDILRSLDIKGRRVFLAQGTLRPDLIESASSIASAFASVIKTHHNDTALVREMRAKGLVVEPLVDFHKDEVRQLAKSLGLPPEIINRHPFPGPGLAIRVICQDEPYIREEFTHINLLLHAVVTYNEAVQQSNSYTTLIADCTSSNEQLFLLELTNALSLHATVLPIYTVGVQGDARSYNYVAALSSNERNIEWTQLFKLAKLIPKICHTINRVVWVFGKVVFGPINDVTPTHLTSGVLATLREADSIVNGILLSQRLMHTVSQMPVILIPIHFDRNFNERPYFPSCQRSIVLRPFLTSDFMTGTPAIPGKDIPLQAINEMVSKIREVPGISRVLYDLTPKPPGTTEWE